MQKKTKIGVGFDKKTGFRKHIPYCTLFDVGYRFYDGLKQFFYPLPKRCEMNVSSVQTVQYTVTQAVKSGQNIEKYIACCATRLSAKNLNY
jgi:hypothetical protein